MDISITKITYPMEASMIKLLQSFLLVMLTSIVFQTYAAQDDKPFAEHKVVLQISDADPTKQTLVLNVANNLVKAYGGPDKVDVEIVAFGPGLRLMFDDNGNKGRIKGLTDNGVRFAACGNTIKKMTSKLGHPPKINSQASVVPAGAARIIELVEQDYILIKP
jgi:intracellular sulfur oxidation DsrE/DsrF family protein